MLTVLARPWRHRLPSGRPFLLLLLAGVTWFGAYNVALNAGEQQVDAGTAALVVTVGPILIALFAGVLLKEGFPRPLLIGIAIAASGVVLISLSTRDESAVDTASTTGVLLCLAAAVLYAIGALAQKPTLTVVTPVMSVWLMCVVGAVVCLPTSRRWCARRATRRRPTSCGWSTSGLPDGDRVQHLVVRAQAAQRRPGRLGHLPRARGGDAHLLGDARRGPGGARVRRRRPVPRRGGDHALPATVPPAQPSSWVTRSRRMA